MVRHSRRAAGLVCEINCRVTRELYSEQYRCSTFPSLALYFQEGGSRACKSHVIAEAAYDEGVKVFSLCHLISCCKSRR
jgi:hypothetical protein